MPPPGPANEVDALHAVDAIVYADRMDITCYREAELTREPHTLPAAVYNLAKHLIARSAGGVVFVPIRSMQYLAILDREEFVFVDNQYKSWIEVAWQHFHPQARTSLEDPVPYEAVIYHPDGFATMRRLMGEFPRAMQLLDDREQPDGPAKVLKFEKRRSPED